MYKKIEFALFLVLSVVLIFSCSTLEKLNSFSAASVLPEKADVFVRLPVKDNLDLCNQVIANFLPEDASYNEKLLLSADIVYVALNTGLDGTKQSVQLAVEGNFPIYTGLALNGKNGWEKIKTQIGKLKYEYYQHSSGIQLAFPSTSVALISSDSVIPMLERCENKVMNNINGENTILTKREQLLSSKVSQIAFYSEKPNLFVKSFIGLDISFGISEVGGIINSSVVKDNQKIYPLDLEFYFEEKKALAVANFGLKAALSFYGKDIKVEQIDDNTILCAGIPVSESKILSLIVQK